VAASSAKHGGDVVATMRLGCSVCQPTCFADQPLLKDTPGASAELHLLSVPLNPTATHALHVEQQLQRMDMALYLAQNTTTAPCTFREVLASNECELWMATMHSEFHALVVNDTFKLVELPAGCRAVSTCWVLKLKAPGVYKACFVARGFLQKQGINFNNTYAPVLHLKNLHLLLTHTIQNSYIIHSMDINNAFLQAHLHKEVYVTQPEGFMDPD
jgi:hypothetical protein